MAFTYRSAISNLPEGYTFRGATLHDAPEIAHLFSQREMTRTMAASAEGIRQQWLNSAFNPAMDARLVFDRRERIAGYIEVWTSPDGIFQPWLWGCVHPAFEGQGIGTALLSWGEARVRLAMELWPKGGRIAHFGAPHSLESVKALCAALGWQAIATQQPRRNTGALSLIAESTALPYDIYAKELAA